MTLAWKRLDGQSGHEAGRELLARLYLGETGETLPEISITPQGKPFFSNSPLYFSVSHTKHHAFCCLARENVGIDAEEMDRKIRLEQAKAWLSSEELAFFAASTDSRDCLLRFWVLKEALAKLTGRGWGNYLKNTRFNPNAKEIQIIDGCYVAVLTETTAKENGNAF